MVGRLPGANGHILPGAPSRGPGPCDGFPGVFRRQADGLGRCEDPADRTGSAGRCLVLCHTAPAATLELSGAGRLFTRTTGGVLLEYAEYADRRGPGRGHEPGERAGQITKTKRRGEGAAAWVCA